MSKKLVYGMAAVAALVAVGLFAAVPPAFIPETTFQGSSLKGWHVLGDAGWRAEKGELTGTPKNADGGWLVLDKSFQDIGFSASFRCTGDCKTGVLLRAEKTATGMKGVYISLTKGDLGSYSVTLDAQGRELSREKLRPAGGQVRYAPDPKRAAASVLPPATGPAAPVFDPAEWNALQLILDADMLRPTLSVANYNAAKADLHALGYPEGLAQYGAEGLANFGMVGALLVGSATESMDGYGPLALYVGGSGEVHFKNLAFRDLMHKSEPLEKVSSHFRMQQISSFYYAWCAAVADFNRDGNQDVVSGAFYYLGPDFTQRREFMPSRTYNVSTEYASDMVDFAYDFTGDGWPDILVSNPNRSFELYVNPKGQSRRWDHHLVIPKVTSEIALMQDIDGDGKPDILYGTLDGIQFASPDPADPTATWKTTTISAQGPANPHGLGIGDINGDGRMDVVAASGWWEQPAKGTPPGPWTYHPQDFGGGGAQMCVYDVNGDGLNDVVTAPYAHQYGLSWFEQKRDSAGKISFVEHPIMSALASKSAGGVVFSEPHGNVCADLDGDGIPDLVVGKRLFSHAESYTDPDPYGPAVLYWYRTVRNPKAPGGAEFVSELIHNRSGVGSHFSVVDLNKDGAPDIITSTDRGTFIFFNKLRAGAATPPAAKK
jgi:hypothetical protein